MQILCPQNHPFFELLRFKNVIKWDLNKKDSNGLKSFDILLFVGSKFLIVFKYINH
jgi:hypothetical protein